MENAEHSLQLSPCMHVHLQSDVSTGDLTFAVNYFATGLNVLQGWWYLLHLLALKDSLGHSFKVWNSQ